MTSSASPRRKAGEKSAAFSRTQLQTNSNPSETLIKAKQERLDNWRTLQELAGII